MNLTSGRSSELYLEARIQLPLWGASPVAGGLGESTSFCLQEGLEELSLPSPTEVQQRAIPLILGGHNTAIQWYTGSGKVSLSFYDPSDLPIARNGKASQL